jgi:hypothetical protein
MQKHTRETIPEDKEVRKEEVVPVVEKMEREPVKKCCQVSDEVKSVCNCCLRSWSLCLNGIEGTCSLLSGCCLFASGLAIGCNKCLEQMDCDGH